MLKKQHLTIDWVHAAATTIMLLMCYPIISHAAVEITPRLTTGIEYTDNYFLSNDNPGSEAESEWIGYVSPGLTVNMDGRRLGLLLNYDPSYNMYDEYSDRNYWEHVTDATGTWQVTRHMGMTLSYGFIRTEDPIDDEDLTIRRGRNIYDRHSSEARIDYRFGTENTIYVLGNYGQLNNEDATIQDTEEYGGGAGVVYWFNIQWGIDFSIEQNWAKYEDSEISDGSEAYEDFKEFVGRMRLNRRFNRQVTGYVQYQHTDHRFDDEIVETNYRVYDGAVGVEYAISSSMDFGLEVHYFVRDFKDSEDESGTPINLSLTKRFSQGSITLSAEGGYDYTTTAAENLGYYVYYGGMLEADYAFTRRFSGDASIGYTYNDYRDQVPSRDDDVYRAGCGLSFQLSRWLTTRLGYTYNAVESNIEANDYVENRGSLDFIIAPPNPYRF